jgi:glycosyltransferase involved in cell wall biosynthesis
MVAERGYAFPADLMPPHPEDNPDGYHESKRVVDINNGFLQAIGSHWKDPGALPGDAFHNAHARHFRSEIRNFLSAQQAQFLALKDPRLCRLLPLWIPMLRTLTRNLAVVRVVRHPDEVHASLLRRSSDATLRGAAVESVYHSDLLWWRYNLEAMAHTRELASFVCTYEQMIGSPRHIRIQLEQRLPSPPHEDSGRATTLHIRRKSCSTGITVSRNAAWNKFIRHFHGVFSQGLTMGEQDAALSAGDFRVPCGCLPAELSASNWEIFAAGAAKELSGTISLPGMTDRRVSAKCHLLPRKRLRRFLFISNDALSKGHIYRVKNPTDALHRIGVEADWMSISATITSSVLNCYSDVILFRCGWDDDVERIITHCNRHRIPVGLDIDDYLFEPELLYKKHIAFITRMPEAQRRQWINKLLAIRRTAVAADYVIVPTEYLAQRALEELARPVRYIPNCFSPENLSLADYWREHTEREGETIRIGYASGTPTHDADFGVISPVFERLFQDYPQLRLRIVGFLEPRFSDPSNMARLERRPLVRHINLAQEMAAFDINLAPLQSNPFCDAKSPLKFFEAALVGVATIATANPTYERAINHGQDGLLAKTPQQWEDALRELIESSPKDIQVLSSAANQKVRSYFDIDRHVEKYLRLGINFH